MGKLPPEERPKAGQRVNEVRAELEGALEAKGEEIKAREKAARLEAEAVDVTLPGPARGAGSLHPMNIALERMIDIFVGMGVERIALLKYNIPNLRYLYENDLRFLTQYR